MCDVTYRFDNVNTRIQLQIVPYLGYDLLTTYVDKPRSFTKDFTLTYV